MIVPSLFQVEPHSIAAEDGRIREGDQIIQVHTLDLIALGSTSTLRMRGHNKRWLNLKQTLAINYQTYSLKENSIPLYRL
jgi:hypothetical protein